MKEQYWIFNISFDLLVSALGDGVVILKSGSFSSADYRFSHNLIKYKKLTLNDLLKYPIENADPRAHPHIRNALNYLCDRDYKDQIL